MCCTYISTEALLANYFCGAAKFNFPAETTYSEIMQYFDYIRSGLPGYVSSDFSKDTVGMVAQKYPEFFSSDESRSITLVKEPDLTYFNNVLQESTSGYIKLLTEAFFKNNVPELRKKEQLAYS